MLDANSMDRDGVTECVDSYHRAMVAAYCLMENPLSLTVKKGYTRIGGTMLDLPRSDAMAMLGRRFYFPAVADGPLCWKVRDTGEGAKMVRAALRKGRIDVGVGMPPWSNVLNDVDFIAASFSLQPEPPPSVLVPKGAMCIRVAELASTNLRATRQGYEPWKTTGRVTWISAPLSAGLREAKLDNVVWTLDGRKVYPHQVEAATSETMQRVRSHRRSLAKTFGMMLGGYISRRTLWVLGADIGRGGIDFGADSEVFKSLLYARSLPVTATGRKRPLLHLVESHQRRLKNGTEIEIGEHLRGVKEVTLGDSVVRIKPPEEVQERIDEAKALKGVK